MTAHPSGAIGERRDARLRAWAWAFYDWANSAFATAVLTVFFPIFLGRYWIAEDAAVDSTFVLGMANGAASLIIVLLAPILGAIADQGSARKRFLGAFALIGILSTACMPVVAAGDWPLATVLFISGVIGFSGANVFYDALLLAVAPKGRRSRLSALGFALGYLGGGIAFALNTLMVAQPAVFGLADSTAAVRWSFVVVALWWLIFSLPLLLLVDEPRRPGHAPGWSAVSAGWRQLRRTLRHIRELRVVALFLLAYWLYIDGVDTVVRMAVDFGRRIGFDDQDLIYAVLLIQFLGFPATLVYGRLAERIGIKAGILVGLGAYTALTVAAYFITATWHFYALAVVVALVQGGVQALSRALYARIIPADKSAELFGFYNLLGKFAAVIGPFLVGWISLATGSPRLAILSIVVLFLAGGALLWRVDVEAGERFASQLDDSSSTASGY